LRIGDDEAVRASEDNSQRGRAMWRLYVERALVASVRFQGVVVCRIEDARGDWKVKSRIMSDRRHA
jgi:hypothetical protein